MLPRRRPRVSDDAGSAPVETLLVGILLTALALAVLQFSLALHVRNTLIDAAAEGARTAALADRSLADGAARTRELIGVAVGDGYAGDVSARFTTYLDRPAVEVTVRAPLPLLGLFGLPAAVEVHGHAAREALDD